VKAGGGAGARARRERSGQPVAPHQALPPPSPSTARQPADPDPPSLGPYFGPVADHHLLISNPASIPKMPVFSNLAVLGLLQDTQQQEAQSHRRLSQEVQQLRQLKHQMQQQQQQQQQQMQMPQMQRGTWRRRWWTRAAPDRLLLVRMSRREQRHCLGAKTGAPSSVGLSSLSRDPPGRWPVPS
jgi:hypothetical protein